MEEEEEAGLPAATGPKCLSALAAGNTSPDSPLVAVKWRSIVALSGLWSYWLEDVNMSFDNNG